MVLLTLGQLGVGKGESRLFVFLLLTHGDVVGLSFENIEIVALVSKLGGNVKAVYFPAEWLRTVFLDFKAVFIVSTDYASANNLNLLLLDFLLSFYHIVSFT